MNFTTGIFIILFSYFIGIIVFVFINIYNKKRQEKEAEEYYNFRRKNKTNKNCKYLIINLVGF